MNLFSHELWLCIRLEKVLYEPSLREYIPGQDSGSQVELGF